MENTKIVAITWGLLIFLDFIWTCLLWHYAGDLVSNGASFEPVWVGILNFAFIPFSFIAFFRREWFSSYASPDLFYGLLLGLLFMHWNFAFKYVCSGELNDAHKGTLTFAWFFWLCSTAFFVELVVFKQDILEIENAPVMDDNVYNTTGSAFTSIPDNGRGDNDNFVPQQNQNLGQNLIEPIQPNGILQQNSNN